MFTMGLARLHARVLVQDYFLWHSGRVAAPLLHTCGTHVASADRVGPARSLLYGCVALHRDRWYACTCATRRRSCRMRERPRVRANI